MTLIDYLRKERGRAARLAAAIHVTSAYMSQMASGLRPIPPSIAVEIEKHEKGQFTCEDARPDITWHRIPDPDWPWHPAGRPLLDVSRTAAAPQEARDAA